MILFLKWAAQQQLSYLSRLFWKHFPAVEKVQPVLTPWWEVPLQPGRDSTADLMTFITVGVCGASHGGGRFEYTDGYLVKSTETSQRSLLRSENTFTWTHLSDGGFWGISHQHHSGWHDKSFELKDKMVRPSIRRLSEPTTVFGSASSKIC